MPPWKAKMLAEQGGGVGEAGYQEEEVVAEPEPELEPEPEPDTRELVKVKCKMGDDVRKLLLPFPFTFDELGYEVESKYGIGGLVLAYVDEDGDEVRMVDDGDVEELMTQEKICVFVYGE